MRDNSPDRATQNLARQCEAAFNWELCTEPNRLTDNGRRDCYSLDHGGETNRAGAPEMIGRFA